MDRCLISEENWRYCRNLRVVDLYSSEMLMISGRTASAAPATSIVSYGDQVDSLGVFVHDGKETRN